jgi:hypothetical protein
MAPCLTTSASPAASSRSGRVGERVRIGNDGARLVEGPDHVLAERMVDGGLAAH